VRAQAVRKTVSARWWGSLLAPSRSGSMAEDRQHAQCA
jgi:hypothetical protein